MATTIPTIPTTTTSNPDVNKIGRTALQNIPEPLARLVASINPKFSIETGKVKGIGPQPSTDDPIAGVVPGSPDQISVTDTTRFQKDPQQTAVHEFVHLVQHNLTPKQRAQIPPDTGNPTVVTDPKYLEAQRKDNKKIYQLPTEQQSYLTQFYQSKQEAFNKGYITKKEMDQVEKTYGPWIKDWNDVKLSNIKQTDPASKTLNTTPRAPLPPVNLQQSNIQFDTTSTSTIPVSPDSSDSLSTPVTWQDKNHSYAADAGAEKPVTSVRPSKQAIKPPVDKDKAERQRFEHEAGTLVPGQQQKKEPHFAPTNTEDEQHNWTSGKDNVPKDYRQQLIKSRIAAVEDPAHKNPFAFTHPLDRQAATFAKAERIIKNPSFAALPDNKKADILSNYYDKYVVPIYQNSKVEPPDKSAWVSQVQKGFFKVSDFYEYSEATNKNAFTDFSASVVHAQASAVQTAGHVGHAILMAGVKTDRKILGLANFFPGSALHTWATKESDYDAKVAEPALRLSQDVIDRPTFWLDTHPSKSYSEKAGSFVGETIVQLPLYETIGAPLGALGKAVSSTGEVGRAANFTRRLATSKAGQFAARRLNEAASSYIGDYFSETPEGQRAGDMAAFMGLGILGEGAGALVKPISKAAMKRVAATNIAIGGKVFHETIADQAEFELLHNVVGTDAAGNPIVHEEGKFTEQMNTAKVADPVKHAAITAEKISQNAMARQLYDKPLNQLSKLQRRKVRVSLAQMASEATEEIPIHVPEVAKHEVTQKLTEDVKDNPELAADIDYAEKKYGKKIVDTTVKAEQDSIAVERGIKSTQGATRNVGRNEAVLADANKKLASGRSPSTKTPTSKTKDSTKVTETLHEDIPKSYVSFRQKAVSNFTNPFVNRASQEKKTLAKFVDGMDDADFVKEISDQMGNAIKFEKPFDMLLWGLHHSEHIPSPITGKIKEILHDQDPAGTIKDWKDEGKRLSAHIDMLAMSGRLNTEGNVFRSTITTSFAGRTRWQKEAEKEAALEEVQNYKHTMGPYKKNFSAEYNAGLKELAKLQTLRKASKTDENFFAAHSKIKKILEDAENR